jgi:hypothetical protein
MKIYRASKEWWRQAGAAGVAGYLLARQKPGGGFGRTSTALPSPETTYLALASLRLLGGLGAGTEARAGWPPGPRGPTGEELRWRPTHS